MSVASATTGESSSSTQTIKHLKVSNDNHASDQNDRCVQVTLGVVRALMENVEEARMLQDAPTAFKHVDRAATMLKKVVIFDEHNKSRVSCKTPQYLRKLYAQMLLTRVNYSLNLLTEQLDFPLMPIVPTEVATKLKPHQVIHDIYTINDILLGMRTDLGKMFTPNELVEMSISRAWGFLLCDKSLDGNVHRLDAMKKDLLDILKTCNKRHDQFRELLIKVYSLLADTCAKYPKDRKMLENQNIEEYLDTAIKIANDLTTYGCGETGPGVLVEPAHVQAARLRRLADVYACTEPVRYVAALDAITKAIDIQWNACIAWFQQQHTHHQQYQQQTSPQNHARKCLFNDDYRDQPTHCQSSSDRKASAEAMNSMSAMNNSSSVAQMSQMYKCLVNMKDQHTNLIIRAVIKCRMLLMSIKIATESQRYDKDDYGRRRHAAQHAIAVLNPDNAILNEVVRDVLSAVDNLRYLSMYLKEYADVVVLGERILFLAMFVASIVSSLNEQRRPNLSNLSHPNEDKYMICDSDSVLTWLSDCAKISFEEITLKIFTDLTLGLDWKSAHVIDMLHRTRLAWNHDTTCIVIVQPPKREVTRLSCDALFCMWASALSDDFHLILTTIRNAKMMSKSRPLHDDDFDLQATNHSSNNKPLRTTLSVPDLSDLSDVSALSAL